MRITGNKKRLTPISITKNKGCLQNTGVFNIIIANLWKSTTVGEKKYLKNNSSTNTSKPNQTKPKQTNNNNKNGYVCPYPKSHFENMFSF